MHASNRMYGPRKEIAMPRKKKTIPRSSTNGAELKEVAKRLRQLVKCAKEFRLAAMRGETILPRSESPRHSTAMTEEAMPGNANRPYHVLDTCNIGTTPEDPAFDTEEKRNDFEKRMRQASLPLWLRSTKKK
jgi:hypothetical protein